MEALKKPAMEALRKEECCSSHEEGGMIRLPRCDLP
jgi:hypothetical protein